MALYTAQCYIQIILINNGSDTIDDYDVSMNLLRTINMIQRLLVQRMYNNSITSEAHRYTSSRNIIVELLQMGTSELEMLDVHITTTDLETADLDLDFDFGLDFDLDLDFDFDFDLGSKGDVHLPLVGDVIESDDDVDCPVVVEELGEEVRVLAGVPDPHVDVTNVKVDPLPRRRRFASTWKRIKRSALRLCCCVR